MQGIVELFLSTDRPFGLALNLLIFALATVAVVRALIVAVRSCPREHRVVSHIANMTDASRESVVDAVAGSASVLEARVEDLAVLHMHRHPIDAAAMTGLTASALRSELVVTEGIGRSLIVLGLLGTLWGLGSAVTSLAATIRLETMNSTALVAAILETLGGLQTAFSTTLAGLFGALAIGFTVGFARRRQVRLMTDFERLMSTRLIPLFDTSDATNLQDAARALEQLERRAAQDMRTMISAIAGEGAALRSRLEKDFDRLEATFESRAQHLIRATGKALESTLSIIGERREGEPTLADYVRTVRSTVADLERSIQSASMLIPELEGRILAAIAQQRTGLEEVFGRHREAMEPLLARQFESIDVLAAVAERTAAISERLGDTLDRFTTSSDEIRTRWMAIDEKITAVGRSCQEAIRSGLREVVAEVQREQQHGSEDRERVARHLATFESELRTHLDRLLEERNRVMSQMTELIDTMRDAVEQAVREVGERLAKQDRSAARELNLGVEQLSREIRGLIPYPRSTASEDASFDGRDPAWPDPDSSAQPGPDE